MTATLTPSCPRCGYELTGTVQTWIEACPLEGVCSECGLTLDWRRVLNPIYGQPRWFAENINRPLWRTWLPTAARSLWPPGFWRDVRMEYPIQGARLMAFLAATVVFVHFVAYAKAGAQHLMGGPLLVSPYGVIWNWNWYRFPPTVPSALFASVWLMTAPLAYLLLTDTLRQSRVKVAHLWRGLVYGLTGLGAVLLATTVLSAADAVIRSTWGPNPFFGRDIYGWLFAVLVCWHLVFWYPFTARYLRLGQPVLTATLMLVVSGLFAAIVAVTGYLVHVSKYS